MSIKHRKEGEVVWKRPGAGFSGTGAYVEIQPAPDDDVPCMICNDPECREWNDTFGLNANTIEEARALAGRQEYDGSAYYHVSECEMHDDQPGDQNA